MFGIYDLAAVQHVEWVRNLCELVSAPERAVELIERGASRAEVFDLLYPYVHGQPNPATQVPFRELYTGNWALNDPELDEVVL